MYYRIKAENLAQLYQKAADKFESMPAFATRQSAFNWTPVSFREMNNLGLDLATGLIDLGVKSRDHVGLFGDNRLEWMLADYAVQFCGAADVPRGRDISDDEIVYIVNHAGIEIAFVETIKLQNRFVNLSDQLPGLKEIILLDPKAEPASGVKKLWDVLDRGSQLRKQGDRRAEERIAGIRPDDLFTLIYTSGTTGQPKGVMLTHSNMTSQVENLPGYHNCNDRVLSVLPIWHIFERVIEMYTISFGGCTYYSSVLTLGDDMKNVEPTFMASAPRLWEKLHERIIKNIKASHPVRQVLFHIAYFLSKQYQNSLYYLYNKYLKIKPQAAWKHWLLMPFHALRWALVMPWYGFFNAAVLERIRLGAGGSLKATISGGGALPIHIDRFFNNVGIPVLEGYGMTETSPVISVRSHDNLVVGTVGPFLKDTEVRICDQETGEVLYPNQNLPYDGKGIRGEIWVRGPQVMKGYYKQEELTAQTIKDGWLRTGDLGMITHNDCLKILGRCKATIVLSSGENVEPEPIEMRLQQSRFIDQCMVVGQDKRYLGALIVPVWEEFRNNGHGKMSDIELSQNEDVRKVIRREIKNMISPSSGFKSFEQIRDFRILPNSFQIGEELTNLHKIKRHVVEERYKSELSELYANGSSQK